MLIFLIFFIRQLASQAFTRSSQGDSALAHPPDKVKRGENLSQGSSVDSASSKPFARVSPRCNS